MQLEKERFGALVPDWFRTDAAWLPECLEPDAMSASTATVDVNISPIGNFMASQHWSVVSMGTNGSGMFLHADSIATSTYHLQIAGRKKWFVCPPTGMERQYGVRHTYASVHPMRVCGFASSVPFDARNDVLHENVFPRQQLVSYTLEQDRWMLSTPRSGCPDFQTSNTPCRFAPKPSSPLASCCFTQQIGGTRSVNSARFKCCSLCIIPVLLRMLLFRAPHQRC